MTKPESSESFLGNGVGIDGKLGWRCRAAAVVEELFPVTEPRHWDALLDLRGALLVGDSWGETLALFDQCRADLEADHYLPFFRLRRLLECHLRLVIASPKAASPRLMMLGLTGVEGAMAMRAGQVIIEWAQAR